MVHLSRKVTKECVFIRFSDETNLILAEIPVDAIAAAGRFLIDFVVPTTTRKEVKFTMRLPYVVVISKWWGMLPVVSLSKHGAATPLKTWRLVDVLNT